MARGAQAKTVLIVDDDDGMRDTLVTVLKDAYRCFTAESAEQALATLHTTQIDLLLTDVRLPGMDGIALVARAKADVPDLKFSCSRCSSMSRSPCRRSRRARSTTS